jgi:hypothetical protein
VHAVAVTAKVHGVQQGTPHAVRDEAMARRKITAGRGAAWGRDGMVAKEWGLVDGTSRARQTHPLRTDGAVKAVATDGSGGCSCSRQMSSGGHESGEMFAASR